MNAPRKLFVFFALLLVCNSVFCQWSKINLRDSPQASDLITDAAFINPDTGFVSSSWGVLYGTVDGGLTWSADTIGDSVFIVRLAFPTPQIGYMTVFGNYPESILKSIDGGKNWFGIGHDYNMLQPNGLYFLNADTGFVANDAGVVFKTTDGGQNWSFQLAGTGNMPIFDLRFINDSVGFIYQNGISSSAAGINITHDAGQTWPYCQNLNFFTAYTGSAILYNDSVVIGLPSNQLIRIKTNQQEPAETIIFNPPSSNRFSAGGIFAREISFVDSSVGMVAYEGAVIRSSDGGNSWVITDTSNLLGGGLEYLVGVTTDEWLVMGTYAQLYITKNAGGIATGVSDLQAVRAPIIYPNPVGNQLMGRFNATEANVTANIISPDGKLVSSFNMTQNSFASDVSQLAPGVYFLVVKTSAVLWVAKFIKQ